MRVTLLVFDALRSFDRPATRAEIEVEAQLDKKEVENGLSGLLRRRILLVSGQPRTRMTYALITGASRPDPARGRYTRDEANKARIAESMRRAHQAQRVSIIDFSVASPPAPSNAPGAARLVRRGILDTRGPGPARCEPHILDLVWRKR